MQKEGEKIRGIAIAYPRVSSDSQVEGTSLKTQREACIEYCKREKLVLDKIFTGEGESAKLIDRPELQELLSYCRKNKGKITHMIVYRWDRFSRKVADHLWLRKELIKLGVTVKSVTELTDDSLAGRLQENILAVFNEYDNDLRTERCTKGMKEKIKQGIWPLSMPFGYKPAKKLGAKEKKMLPDIKNPEVYPYLEKAFKMYLTGNYSIAEVCRKIKKVSNGKFKMYPQKLQYALKNKYYYGILVCPFAGEDFGKEFRGLHEPMVTRLEYEKIQQIMKGKGLKVVTKRRLNPDFPLKFINCACEHHYTGSWSKGNGGIKGYYYCYHAPRCSEEFRSVPKDVLEDDFLDYLGKLRPKKEFLAKFEQSVTKVWKDKYERVNDDYLRYEGQLNQLKEYKTNLVEKNAKGILPDEEFQEALEKVKRDIELTEIAMNDSRVEMFDLEATIEYANHFISNLARQWYDLGIEGKVRFQKLLFPKGLAYLGNGNFRTSKLCVIFEINEEFQKGKTSLVGPEGFEPSTYRL
jgi:site-specific DNA recombinase